jgi:hypothetical protein
MRHLLNKRSSRNRSIWHKRYPTGGRQEQPGDQLNVRAVQGHNKNTPTRQFHPILRTEGMEKVLAQAGIGEEGGRHGIRRFFPGRSRD